MRLSRSQQHPTVGSAWRRRVWRHAVWILVPLLMILPLVIDQHYPRHILNVIGIQIILALSLNLLVGYTGLVSVGHAGFYAIGAYGSTLLVTQLGVPFLLSALSAIVLTGMAGAVMSLPILRLRESHYLAIATLALGEIVRIIILNAPEVTNGPNGIRAIPPPNIFGFEIATVAQTNYFLLAVVLLLLLLLRRLIFSPVGKVFMAIREDETACQAVGVNTTYYKVLAFALSAAIAGLAGVIYAHYIRYISPDSFTWRESISILTMTVVGGLGSIAGAVYGAVTLVLVSEYLRSFGSFRFVFYGLVLIVVVLFSPGGIAAGVKRLSIWLSQKWAQWSPATLYEGDSL